MTSRLSSDEMIVEPEGSNESSANSVSALSAQVLMFFLNLISGVTSTPLPLLIDYGEY